MKITIKIEDDDAGEMISRAKTWAEPNVMQRLVAKVHDQMRAHGATQLPAPSEILNGLIQGWLFTVQSALDGQQAPGGAQEPAHKPNGVDQGNSRPIPQKATERPKTATAVPPGAGAN